MKFSSVFEKKSQRRGGPPPDSPTMLGPLLGGGNKLAPPRKNPGYATALTQNCTLVFGGNPRFYAGKVGNLSIPGPIEEGL